MVVVPSHLTLVYVGAETMRCYAKKIKSFYFPKQSFLIFSDEHTVAPSSTHIHVTLTRDTSFKDERSEREGQ